MTQSGSVVEVLVQARGSQVIGDHVAGATTLLVEDPTPFDDAGGAIYLDEVAYTFLGVTEVPDPLDPANTNAELELEAPGLVADVADLSPVDLWNGSQVLDDAIVLVSVGTEADPPVPVVLTVDQRAFWEARVGPVDPPVAVVLSDNLDRLEDAPGYTPTINGAAIEPGTLPPPVLSDGEAPEASPTPTVLGGVGVLHVRWPGIVNEDPVTYEVHVSTADGFAPDPATLVTTTDATSATVKALTDGTSLAYGPEDTPTTYYVRVIAKDVDGAAPPSPQASGHLFRIGTEQISALYAYLGTVTADQITTGKLDAEVTLSGEFKTADTGQRVVMDTKGIHLYRSTGTALVDLPTDPNAEAQFNGKATMSQLSVAELAVSSQGHVKTNATMTLDAALGAPGTGPEWSIGYDSLQVTGIEPPPSTTDGTPGTTVSFRGFHADDQQTLVVVYGAYEANRGGAPHWIAIAPPGGGEVTGYLEPYGSGIGASTNPVYDVCALGSGVDRTYYVLTHLAGTEARVFMFNADLERVWEVSLEASDMELTGLFTDGTGVYVALRRKSTNKIGLLRWNADLSALTATYSTNAYLTSSSARGWGGATGNMDFGSSRLVLPYAVTPAFNAQGFHVQSFSGATYAIQTGESFPGPTGPTPTALAWNEATDEFWSHTTPGPIATVGGEASLTLYRHTGNKWTAAGDDTWWLSSDFAYYDGADALTYQTPQSPKTKLTMVKRAKLVVSGPALPPDDPSYAFDPTWARVFVGKGTTQPARTAMFYMGRTNTEAPVLEVRTFPTFAGTDNPPATSNFPNATPSKLQSAALRADQTPKTNLGGDGAANVDGLLPPGSITMFAATAVPTGWLRCDGQAVSRTLYPDLFASIGTSFGVGDGSTTFNVPNFASRFPTLDAGTPGTTGGSTALPVPQHNHTMNHSHTAQSRPAAGGIASLVAQGGGSAAIETDTAVNAFSGVTGITGGTTAYWQPYLHVNFIIKT